MNSLKYLLLFFSMVSFLFLSAQSAVEKGLEIAQTAYDLDRGYKSSVSDVSMILRNKKGQESTRELVIKAYEMSGDGNKSMILFNIPKDMKGTALLTYAHKQDSDDQWLYLPAVGRVKRISSDNKSGPFMGSEYAYEDLVSSEVEKYTYTYLGKEGDMEMVERIPTDPKSGYSKQIVWYNSAKKYRVKKIEYYDRKSTLMKTLVGSDYKLYQNKYWKPLLAVMSNHQTLKSTTLKVNKLTLRAGLNESDFEQVALKRARN